MINKIFVKTMLLYLQHSLYNVNLLIKDVCFMLNKMGNIFWSEINQDCMRITTMKNDSNKFDKDIWRYGGSTSRNEILNRWTHFNEIFIEYFRNNKFHETELFNFNSLN